MSGEDGCTINERVLGTRACTYHGRNNDEDDAQLVREAWTVPPIVAHVNGGGGCTWWMYATRTRTPNGPGTVG